MAYLHPGIYIEEQPGARTIEGVSTDTGGFIGIAEMGPYNTPTFVESWSDFLSKFGGTLWNCYLGFAVYSFFAAGGKRTYVTRLNTTGAGGNAGRGSVKIGAMTVMATSPGDWSESLEIEIANYPGGGTGTTDGFSVNVVIAASALTAKGSNSLSADMLRQYVKVNAIPEVEINKGKYYRLEEHSGFTAQDLAPKAAPAQGTTADASCALADRINARSIFIRVSADAAKTQQRTPNGLNAISGAAPVHYDFDTAIKSFETNDEVRLFAMPDSVNFSSNKGQDPVGQRNLLAGLLNMVSQRADAFAIVDPPAGLDVTQVKDFKQASGAYKGNALNSDWGALYYPWIETNVPGSGATIMAPPSGYVAGRYAYTDATRGVFKAPAGVDDGKLSIAVNVAEVVTEARQDVLNPIGVNAIRPIRRRGICIYGTRTLSLDPEWRYVPVRRAVTYIERSIYEGIQWVVFEPNDQRLWGSVTREITAFLTSFWRDGGLFGVTPQEAFYVIADETNNPPETRDNGILYVDVGLATVKPAEFIVLRITQMVQTGQTATPS